LNRCLDDAIAGAVTEYGLGRNQATVDAESARRSERVGFLAHQVQNLIDTTRVAWDVIKTGNVGVGGSTAAVLDASLVSIRALLARSLADVRVPDPVLHREPFLMSGFIDALAPAAALEANARGISLTVIPVEDGVVVDGDRQVLAAVVSGLLQNAFKLTGPRTTVTLRVGASAERVMIEILDECSELPDGNGNELFHPFDMLAGGAGASVGLAFAKWGVEANDGRIYARNLPEQGCVFTVDLPRLPVPAVMTA
jgi:signal transduction histidine kinase